METISQSQTCELCIKEINRQEVNCPYCAYPVTGSVDERDHFRYQYNNERATYQSYMLEALTATKSLYWISGLSFVGNLVIYAVNHEEGNLIAAFLVPMLFVPLALWSRTSPFPALLTAVILYGLITLGDLIMAPETIAKGVIIKVLIFYYLIKGVQAGNKSRKAWAELIRKRWTQPF